MANQQVPEKVVRILMRDIFNNKLKPGTKLPSAKEISMQMKVDLSSLRIGLKQLESMNVLDIKQGDGTMLKTMSNMPVSIFSVSSFLRKMKTSRK
jgi:GntR family transcriptional repressor for pyruvate dehydrogenase complex